jgi:hypothetical protein
LKIGPAEGDAEATAKPSLNPASKDVQSNQSKIEAQKPDSPAPKEENPTRIRTQSDD